MLTLLTRQRDVLKNEEFFNTLREYVGAFSISADWIFTATVRKHPDSFKSPVEVLSLGEPLLAIGVPRRFLLDSQATLMREFESLQSNAVTCSKLAPH